MNGRIQRKLLFVRAWCLWVVFVFSVSTGAATADDGGVLVTNDEQILLKDFELIKGVGSKGNTMPLELNIRDEQTILKDFNLIDEISGYINESHSCEIQIQNITEYFTDRYVDVLRIQSLLNYEKKDLGRSGCDGKIGAYTLHALGSQACKVVVSETPRRYANCQWMSDGPSVVSHVSKVVEQESVNQFFWTENDTALLDEINTLEDKILNARASLERPAVKLESLLLDIADPTNEQVVRLSDLLRKNKISLMELHGWVQSPDRATQVDVKSILSQKLTDTAFPTQSVFEDAVCDYLNNRKFDSSIEWMGNVNTDSNDVPESLEGLCGYSKKPPYLNLLSQLAYKERPPIDRAVDYTNNDCGCAQPQDNAAIYGLYPYWITQELENSSDNSEQSESPKSSFDFSLYNKVEFLVGSLIATRTNDIQLQLDDNNLNRNNSRVEFANESNRHLSEVEMLIHIDQAAFTGLSLMSAQRRILLAKQIAKIFSDDGFSGITFWLPVLDDDSLKTEERLLHFVNLISSLREEIGESTGRKPAMLANLIPSIIPKLFAAEDTADDEKKQLDLDIQRVENQRPPINMMIAGTFDQYTRSMKHYKNLIWRAYAGPATVIDKQLVFLTQPTTKNKKRLREYIETTYSGSSRRNALRKIVPLTLPVPIVPGRATGDFDEDLVKNQMFSDLNYYEDNFAGTGTWGMSLVNSGTSSMAALIKSVFDQGHTSSAIKFCDYVCPRRALIAPVLALLSLGLLGFLLVQKANCFLRKNLMRFDRPAFATGLVLIALWYLFVSCVPTWEPYRYTLMMAVGLMLLALVWMWIVRKGRVDP